MRTHCAFFSTTVCLLSVILHYLQPNYVVMTLELDDPGVIVSAMAFDAIAGDVASQYLFGSLGDNENGNSISN